jgi:hypothetical protein
MRSMNRPATAEPRETREPESDVVSESMDLVSTFGEEHL